MKPYILIVALLLITLACGTTATITAPTATLVPTEYSFSGSGNQATDTFQLYAGLVRVEMTHSGKYYFNVDLLDEHGKDIAMVGNQMGPGDSSKAVQVKSSGPYLLNVTASGEWTITVTQ